MQNDLPLSRLSTEAEIQQKLEGIVSRCGKWTAHRIRLSENIYTIPENEHYDVHALRRVLQIVSDNLSKPLSEARIVDLGCLEGGYSIEMAMRGAQVVGVEGREINIEKARFAKETLNLGNVEFVQDDVRNLNAEKYGTFDAVLVLGLLYHLDTPDAFHFIKRASEVCREFIVIDTTISMHDHERVDYDGKAYWGHRWSEFSEDADEIAKSKSAWSSLDNNTSFCFTKPSLYNLLRDAGFSSVYECHHPSDLSNYQDRITLLARKSTPVTLQTQPDIGSQPVADFPEKEVRLIAAPFNKEPEKKRWLRW